MKYLLFVMATHTYTFNTEAACEIAKRMETNRLPAIAVVYCIAARSPQ
jgi:hypothetical protein